MPGVVTDGNAPKSFVREFLGTLFGGNGGIPVPSGGSWTTVTFCMSKVVVSEWPSLASRSPPHSLHSLQLT